MRRLAVDLPTVLQRHGASGSCAGLDASSAMLITDRQFVPEPKRHAKTAVRRGLDHHIRHRILMKRLHDQSANLTGNGPTTSFR